MNPDRGIESVSRAYPLTALAGSVLGLLLVILAAAGAHLVPPTETQARELWHTAQFMHLTHALALLAVAALMRGASGRFLNVSAVCFGLGASVFCGSLYLRAAVPNLALVLGLPGPVTPIGGMLMIAGWVLLIVHFMKSLLAREHT